MAEYVAIKQHESPTVKKEQLSPVLEKEQQSSVAKKESQSPGLESQPAPKAKQARAKRIHDDIMPSEPTGPCVLALTKVRRIAKSETKISMLGGDAAYLLAKSAELFIWHLAQDAFCKAKADSRKTLQYKDLAAAVKDRPAYEFLLDVIPPTTTRDEYLNSIYAVDPPRIVPKLK